MTVLLGRIVVLLNQVLSALGVVSGLAQNTAQEHLKYQIENTVVATSLNVGSPTFGLAALHTLLTTIDAKLDALALDLADIPTGPQLAGSPVTLPTIPPTGYGVDDGTIASAVWGYILGPGTQAAGDLLHDSGWSAVNHSIAGAPALVATSPYFVQFGSWAGNLSPEGPTHGPIFPLANILIDDTLSTFLERESYYTDWAPLYDGTYQTAMGDGDFYYRTTIVPEEFIQLRDSLFSSPAASGLGAPVWPGLANVTLSTPVSIATGLTITEAMDGVIVNLTGVPTRANFFQFDDKPRYRNLGALAFFDDDGELEDSQNLGFEQEIYTPQRMFQAAGVKLRAEGGVSGTVTPWIKTPV